MIRVQAPALATIARGRVTPVAVLIWAVGLLVAVAWASPLVWMVSTSVKPPSQVMTKTIEWLPREVTFDNYRKVLEKPVLRWLLNSSVVAGAGEPLGVVTRPLGGVALGRPPLFGGKILVLAVGGGGGVRRRRA